MLASYEWIVKNGLKAKGKTSLLALMNNEKVSLSKLIEAKCYECMGYFADGAVDCLMADCPLYSRMPYRKGGVKKLRVVDQEKAREQMVKVHEGNDKRRRTSKQ